MATAKRASIEKREVSVKKLFEDSCVIPQGIQKAAAGQISCFRLKAIGSPKRKSYYISPLRRQIISFCHQKPLYDSPFSLL